MDVVLEHELRTNEMVLRVAQYANQPISEIRRMDIIEFEQLLSILEKQAKAQNDKNAKH